MNHAREENETTQALLASSAALGTKPSSLSVFVLSAAPKVLRGNVVLNWRLPCAFPSAWILDSRSASVASAESVPMNMPPGARTRSRALLLLLLFVAAEANEAAEAAGGGAAVSTCRPSRSAFSRAAFSALSRLSASIWALTRFFASIWT